MLWCWPELVLKYGLYEMATEHNNDTLRLWLCVLAALAAVGIGRQSIPDRLLEGGQEGGQM